MHNRRKYIVAILFLAVGVAILLGIFYWFNVYSRKDFNSYTIVFHESVDGLATHSAVRYNGVLVGFVDSINLDKNSPNSIDVTVNLDKAIPIYNSTRATLKTQGITGLYYIGLKNLDYIKNPQKLVAKPGQKPVIESSKSLSSVIFDSTEKITDNISTVSKQATEVLTPENLNNLKLTLHNMALLSQKLATNSDELSVALKRIISLSDALQNNSKNLNEVMAGIKKLSNSVLATNDSVNRLVQDFDNNTLANFNNNLLPNLNQSTVSFNKNMLELQKTLKLLNKNPSSLIRGLPIESYGPGEK